MEKRSTPKRQFHTKSRLLTLYLSIGIIGICMIVFSAWTPFSSDIKTSAASDKLLQSEHTPSNEAKPDSGKQDAAVPEADDTQSSVGTNDTASEQSPTEAPATDLPTPSPTPSATPTPTPNPLLTNAYAEVNTLIEEYYQAKLTGDAAAFDTLVSDPSAIDIDYLHIQYSLVTDFSNFTCYTKNGINEIAYIVYVSYDSKIVTIDTPVPILDRLTLVYADDGSGRLLVNTASALSDEVTAYCDEIFTHEDVRQMYSQETERFENAIASDPDLSQLYNRLDSEDAN